MDLSFVNEAQKTLKHAISSDYTIDNAFLELNSLRLVHRASDDDCIQAIVPIILALTPDGSVTESVAKWVRLLHKFVHSHANELTVLRASTSVLSSSSLLPVLAYLLPLFYKLDIVNDDAVHEWYSSSDAVVKAEASKFVDWLKESDNNST